MKMRMSFVCMFDDRLVLGGSIHAVGVHYASKAIYRGVDCLNRGATWRREESMLSLGAQSNLGTPSMEIGADIRGDLEVGVLGTQVAKDVVSRNSYLTGLTNKQLETVMIYEPEGLQGIMRDEVISSEL
jgi:hypothetical protein